MSLPTKALPPRQRLLYFGPIETVGTEAYAVGLSAGQDDEAETAVSFNRNFRHATVPHDAGKPLCSSQGF